MDNLYNIWNLVCDFLTHISWGSVLLYMGTGATIFFGIDKWRLSHRKPKARLRLSNGKKEISFSPHYYRVVSHKYFVDSPIDCHVSHQYNMLLERYNKKHENDNEFILTFKLENTGKLQLENYKVEIEYDAGIQQLGVRANQSFVLQDFLEHTYSQDGVSLNISKHMITYEPEDKRPLNQKDHKYFAVRFSPHPDIEQIELRWRISAKDFNDQGKFVIHIKPTVTEYDKIHFATCDRDIPEGAEKIEDLTPYIQHFQELLKNE